MKKLVLALAAIFLFTGIAAATDFSMSGSYYARGTWRDNLAVGNADPEAYGNLDQELSVDATWQIDDTSKVFARFEMRDETWATAGVGENANVGAENDDNIVVEQVWGAHTFGNGGTLTVGLMSGGAWAGYFGNNGNDVYRIKWVQPISVGTLIAIYEKGHEGGSIDSNKAVPYAAATPAVEDPYAPAVPATAPVAAVDDDETDVDKYILALPTKLGAVTVKPLFVWVDNEPANADVIVLDVEFSGGDADGFSWVTEWVYSNTSDGDSGDAEPVVWGAYAELTFAAGPATWGLVGAYGSYDDDEGGAYSFGDDFEAGGALIMGDDLELVGPDLGAGYLIAGKVSYAATDQLTLGAYVGFYVADDDYEDDAYGGADIDTWEISARASYAITANVTYSVAAGIADVEDADDNSVELHSKLAFSF